MKRLTRSTHNKVIAGVSAGIADYLSIDPVIIRLLMVFLFIATGFLPIIALYIVAIFIVPKQTIVHDATEV